jgi:beta-glucosidase
MKHWISAIAAMLLISCSAGQKPAGPAPRAGPNPLASYDPEVLALLDRMSLDEKIGQMVQAECNGLASVRDVRTYHLGSILSGGNGDPMTNSLEDWTDLYDSLQKEALQTRLGIPILYGVDAVHGHNNVLGAVIFPHNIGLGCTRDAALVEKIGEITAQEVRATGINWTFAPCVTVPQDDRWGRTYEGFSEDPSIAGELGAAAVRGLQGANLAEPLRILACAKHYAGDGGTKWGTGKEQYPLDRGDVPLGEESFRALHIAPYLPAIEAGAGSIMPSYSSWNGVKCSVNRRLLTEILKAELGFQGFLISDYDAIDETPGDYRTQIKNSVLAGMDMFMVPRKYKELIGHLKDLVERQEVPVTRIDDSVRRILRVKAAMGLLDKNRNHLADRSLHASFGSAEHRAVAREAVRRSVVLLKNERRTLPLGKNLPRVHVAGRNADDLGNQCGGWTISWQGSSGAVTPGGTTILAGIKAAVSPGTRVTFSKDGSGAAGASAGIVVVGEAPYAEMNGDTESLDLASADREAVAAVKKAGIPLVVVLVSGRVMTINDELAAADAFLAAWLPGTEGQGVADVLFGGYAPTGKLSYSWPRSLAQLPLNAGQAGYDPLFGLGFGLTY